jgi:hypothetical protein
MYAAELAANLFGGISALLLVYWILRRGRASKGTR